MKAVFTDFESEVANKYGYIFSGKMLDIWYKMYLADEEICDCVDWIQEKLVG